MASLVFSLVLSWGIGPSQAKSIDVIVDNKYIEMDSEGVNQNGHVLLPFRGILNSLGIGDEKIAWDGENREVKVQEDDMKIRLTIDSDLVVVNGEEIKLDEPARIMKDRTLIPARFIAESLGARVDWDQPTKTVLINSSKDSIRPIKKEGKSVIVYEEVVNDYFKTDEIEKRMGKLEFNQEEIGKYKTYTAKTDFGYVEYQDWHNYKKIDGMNFKTEDNFANLIVIDKRLSLGDGFLKGIKVGDDIKILLDRLPEKRLQVLGLEYIYLKDIDGDFYKTGADYLAKRSRNMLTYSASRPSEDSIFVSKSLAMSDSIDYQVHFNLEKEIIKSIEILLP